MTIPFILSDLRSSQTRNTSGYVKPFWITANFTRPNDAIAYANNDVISNSTSSTTLMTADLSALEIPNGALLSLFYGEVITTGATALVNTNIIVSNRTFVPGADNTAFNITDTEAVPPQYWAELGLSTLATPGVNNNRIWLGNSSATLKLDTNSSSIFFCLVSKAARTPVALEVFHVVLGGRLIV